VGGKKINKRESERVDALSVRDAFGARSRNMKLETHHMQSWSEKGSLSIAGS